MKVLKAREMAEIDRRTIEEIGIPSLVLMENAARGVFVTLKSRFPDAKRVVVVAGKGNNGGDGIAVARMLHLNGYRVDVFLPAGEPKVDAKVQLEILRRMGVSPLREKPRWREYDLIVDAIFGTGFEPPARGEFARVIEDINSAPAPVLSVDIPSGLSADTGRVLHPCVRADVTVTFQFPKVCHVLYPASKLCGEVVVRDISIPPQLAEGVRRETIEPSSLKLPRREPDTYKNREGHVLIVGGSRGKTGAVIMSALSATRTGSGLVTVGVPEDLNHILETSLVEEMSLPLPGRSRLSYFAVEEILSLQDRFSVLALGMGMDRYEEGQDIVRELILNWKKPILLDADAINNLADLGDLSILREREGATVLTPHVGEFSRLTGLSAEEILCGQMDVAVEFSSKYACYLVLKAARTVIATPEGYAHVSLRGTPAMAKGGVGDVLSGILTALMGKMEDTLSALRLGVFLHGIAGELAEGKTHRESLKAREIAESIPEAYRAIEALGLEKCARESDTIN